MAGGFIALARGILDHPIVGARKPYDRHSAWEWLLFEAAYKPHRYAAGSVVVNLERGQLAHSTRYMANAWGWPETNVRRYLKRLKADAMIGAATDAGITVITICNYDPYQSTSPDTGALTGAAPGAESAHQRRRKEQGNKETKKTKEREEGLANGKVHTGQHIEVGSVSWNTWKAYYRDTGNNPKATQMEAAELDGESFSVPTLWPPNPGALRTN